MLSECVIADVDPYAELRQAICEMGRRAWLRGYVTATDGNLSVRLPEDRVLCTPTGVSKGFLTPGQLGVVSRTGELQLGDAKPTSEILMHLALYEQLPAEECMAVVHTHAPHATAYALAGVTPPNGLLPEIEFFTGPIGMAAYETPGGWEFARQVARQALPGMNTVILRNHGVVTWGRSIEQAYFNTEIIDGYCRVLLLCQQLGGPQPLPPEKVNELLDLRSSFGMPVDPRRRASPGDFKA